MNTPQKHRIGSRNRAGRWTDTNWETAPAAALANTARVMSRQLDVIYLIQNQDFVEEKFKELDSDQIEGGEFEFWCLETRFERNEEEEFTEFDF